MGVVTWRGGGARRAREQEGVARLPGSADGSSDGPSDGSPDGSVVGSSDGSVDTSADDSASAQGSAGVTQSFDDFAKHSRSIIQVEGFGFRFSGSGIHRLTRRVSVFGFRLSGIRFRVGRTASNVSMASTASAVGAGAPEIGEVVAPPRNVSDTWW